MFEHVRAGQRWQPKEFEINAMMDAAQAYAGGSGVTARGGQAGQALRPATVRVVNKTGADIIRRYRAFSITNSQWTLDNDRNISETVFGIVQYRSDLPVAVVQQPIERDAIGYAIVYGPTLVECAASSSTSLRGTPEPNGTLFTGSGPVAITQPAPAGGGIVLAVLGGGSEGGALETDLVYNQLAIPARVQDTTGGYTHRHGRQFCFRVATVLTADGQLRSFVWNTTVLVFNASHLPIPEKQFLPVMKINGYWFVDQRGVQTDPPTPDPEPPPIVLDRLFDGDPLQERILI